MRKWVLKQGAGRGRGANHSKHGLPRRSGGEKYLIKRKSLKAWVAKKVGEKIDKKKIIESMGCQEGGRGKIDQIIKTSVAKKARGGEIIESMGCQEGGGGEKLRKKSLKAWVAKKARGWIIQSLGCKEGRG